MFLGIYQTHFLIKRLFLDIQWIPSHFVNYKTRTTLLNRLTNKGTFPGHVTTLSNKLATVGETVEQTDV